MAQKLWFKKKSPLHGSGLFAKNDIKKGSKVIEYIGDKVTKKEGDKRADKQIRKAKKDKMTIPDIIIFLETNIEFLDPL